MATVLEPLDVLVPYICHHLALGATSMTLYLDDPEDPSALALSQIPGVKLVPCDDAYWQSQGLPGRPIDLVTRQLVNLNHVRNAAQREHEIEWILHIDADELLFAPKGIQQELDQMGPADEWLAIKPLERIWPGRAGRETFGGAFRAPLKQKSALESIYGPAAPFLWPNGFTSYTSQKVMFPVSTSHGIRVHRLYSGDDEIVRPHRVATSAYILHFATLTPMHWATKLLRYALDPTISRIKRPAYLRALHKLVHSPDLRAESLKMYSFSTVLPRKSIKELKRRKLLFEPRLNLKRDIAKIAPHMSVDLTTGRLEQSILPQFEAVVAEVEARRDSLSILPDQHGETSDVV